VPASPGGRSCRRRSSVHARSSWCLTYSTGRKLADGATSLEGGARRVQASGGRSAASSWKKTHHDSLQPNQPRRTSPVGEFINSAATKTCAVGRPRAGTRHQLSGGIGPRGDHSTDIFSTVRQPAVAGIRDCPKPAIALRRIHTNLPTSPPASNTPTMVANATRSSRRAVTDLRGIRGRREQRRLGVTFDHLTAITPISMTAAVTSRRSTYRNPDGVPELKKHLPTAQESAVQPEFWPRNFATNRQIHAARANPGRVA